MREAVVLSQRELTSTFSTAPPLLIPSASSVAATKTPILFIGTGEHLHDLDKFSPKPFISKMLGMGDLQGLMEQVQDVSAFNDPKKQQDMLNKMEKGSFSIRDMREQMNTVLSMSVFSLTGNSTSSC